MSRVNQPNVPPAPSLGSPPLDAPTPLPHIYSALMAAPPPPHAPYRVQLSVFPPSQHDNSGWRGLAKRFGAAPVGYKLHMPVRAALGGREECG